MLAKKTRSRIARGGGGRYSYVPPKWRYNDLIEALGSDTDISAKIAARGYPAIPRSSIAGWKMRNSIPPVWVPVLIQLALDERLINSIDDLRKR